MRWCSQRGAHIHHVERDFSSMAPRHHARVQCHLLAQTLGTGPQGAPYRSTLHGLWVLMVDSSCWHSTACTVLWPQLSQQLHHLYFPLPVPKAQLLQRLQNPPDPSIRSHRCCLCLERMICSFWLLLLSLNVTFTLPPRPSNIGWQLPVFIILYSSVFSVSFLALVC